MSRSREDFERREGAGVLSVLIGDAAGRRALSDPERVAREFKTQMILDGSHGGR